MRALDKNLYKALKSVKKWRYLVAAQSNSTSIALVPTSALLTYFILYIQANRCRLMYPILVFAGICPNIFFFSRFQYWSFSKFGEIRRDEMCIDYAGAEVFLFPCHGSKGNQLWIYKSEVS